MGTINIEKTASSALSDATFKNIAGWIERECGIALNDTKKYLIQTRLAPIIAHLGCDSFDSFYRAVAASNDPKLRARIIDAITTNETLWFRDASLWKFIEEQLLADLAKRRESKVRVWSVACSTGQEIFSFCMLLDRLAMGNPSIRNLQNRLECVATDISPNVLSAAERGKYSRLEMSRGLTPDYKASYFDADRLFSTLKPQIRDKVSFSQLNLQDNFRNLGMFDVIMCRNVNIYFSKEFRQDLLTRMERNLKPGGLLILGSSESLLGYQTILKRPSFGPACIYQKDMK